MRAAICRRSALPELDRKSTRLNSSHLGISYAVFCLKKKYTCHGPAAQVDYNRKSYRIPLHPGPDRRKIPFSQAVHEHLKWCQGLFFFNDTATTEIYTLSLHDALPISTPKVPPMARFPLQHHHLDHLDQVDRKSTRLNSSHLGISYAVFCLKKKRR